MGRASQGGERIDCICVDLTGIRLSRNGIGMFESGEFCDAGVESFDLLLAQLHYWRYLFMIAVEQSEEGGLCSRRALYAAKSNIVSCANQIPQIPQQFLLSPISLGEGYLKPQASPFTDSGQLCGLKMCPSQRRKIFIAHGKFR